MAAVIAAAAGLGATLLTLIVLNTRADLKDCHAAQHTDTRAAWEGYLRAHPDGECSVTARVRLESLP